MRHMNARLEKIVITELRDDTFFALLWIRQDGELMTMDARPSDAIALALRADCPIYVCRTSHAISKVEHGRSTRRPHRRSNSAAGSKASTMRTLADTRCREAKLPVRLRENCTDLRVAYGGRTLSAAAASIWLLISAPSSSINPVM